jgi:hypothetical protein
VLPDFVRVKRIMNRRLLRWLETQISATNPLIQNVSRFSQHEGKMTTLHRADDSKSDINFREAGAEFTQGRAEMRQFDIEAIKRKLLEVARSMGEQQSKRMLELVNEAATESGNVVNAGGQELTADHLFEMLRKVQMDFDPRTGNPTPGFTWVMHPDMAAKVIPKIKEWEKDPAFNAEHERIMSEKREEWRAREANRKLVG